MELVEVQFALCPAKRKRPSHTSIVPPRNEPARPVDRDSHPPRISQVLAMAILHQERLERGEANSYAELAKLANLTRSRVSQMMTLLWLAPDIQEELLDLVEAKARIPIREAELWLIARHLSWGQQRALWDSLKTAKLL
jgi:hypothetical protein